MRTNTLFSVSTLLVTLLIALIFASCGGEGGEAEPEIERAPAAEIQDFESGETLTFPDDWEGRAVAVSFFSPG